MSREEEEVSRRLAGEHTFFDKKLPLVLYARGRTPRTHSLGEADHRRMCLILVLFKVRPDYPLIVAANRDERRDRPATPPFRWEGDPVIWAGRDEVAGGTWFGVNAAGLLAAVTNRSGRPIDPSLPSRGNLCLQALHESVPERAVAGVAAQLSNPSNSFNLFCANTDLGWVTTWQGTTRKLSRGRHVISSRGDPDDSALPVIRRARRLLHGADLRSPGLEDLLRMLGGFCANTGGRTPICRPGGDHGTVSSSLIALDAEGQVAAYWHANGPPSEIPYQPINVAHIQRPRAFRLPTPARGGQGSDRSEPMPGALIVQVPEEAPLVR